VHLFAGALVGPACGGYIGAMPSPNEQPRCLILVDIRETAATSLHGADGWLCAPGQEVPGERAPAEGLRAVAVADRGPLAEQHADMLWVEGDDITHRLLIEACAQSGLPVAISAAGASLNEVSRAIGWHQLAFRGGSIPPCGGGIALPGGGRVIVVHEPRGKPALRAMQRITSRTYGPVGFYGENKLAPLAVAAGASLIVLSAGDGLADAVTAVREAEAALGGPRLVGAPGAGRRSVVAARDLTEGAELAMEDVAFHAVGDVADGYEPYQAESMTGRALLRAIKQGEPILKSDLDGKEPEPPPWFSPKPK
jgi:hypothetical protein